MSDLERMTAKQLEAAAHKQQTRIRKAKMDIDAAQNLLREIHIAWRLRGLEERLADAKKKLAKMEAAKPDPATREGRQLRATQVEVEDVKQALERVSADE